jgi:hypothetical protein
MGTRMILTPKNWKSFQHYKERTPPWIKLHKGLLDDFEFSRLPDASRALAPMVWLLASEYEDGAIKCSIEQMAFRLHTTVENLKLALSPLIDSGFFSASEALAPCKRDACLETEAEGEAQGKKETDKPPVAEATRGVSEKFEEFWKERPRRDGDDPRKPAEKKFNALVKTGVDPDVMISGAKLASVAARERGIYGTKFVPQTVKWLNDQRFVDYAAEAYTAAQTPAEEGDAFWDAVLTSFKRFGTWSREAGPNLESPDCRVPPEMLSKHGLLRADEINPLNVPRLKSMGGLN